MIRKLLITENFVMLPHRETHDSKKSKPNYCLHQDQYPFRFLIVRMIVRRKKSDDSS